jgi:dUTP pyrophosphatase
MIVVRMRRLDPRARIPQQATRHSAGFDLEALDHVSMRSGGRRVVGTGLAVEIPPGFALLIMARSGLAANHGIRPSNCVGLVDADYRGEIKVALTMDPPGPGLPSREYEINPGDRIAQVVILRLPDVILEEAEELSETERGAGGFGSTG